MDDDGQLFVALHEAGADALGFGDDLDVAEVLEDLFPDHLQLQLCEAIAHAAMNTIAE